MGVEAKFVPPIGQCRKIVLPESELRPARKVDEIVVAAESPLGRIRHVHGIVAGSSRPDDIVLQLNGLAVANDLERISIQLHYRVVNEIERAAAGLRVLQQNTPVAIVVNKAVADQVVAMESLVMNSGVVVVGNDPARAPCAVPKVKSRSKIPVSTCI